MKKFSIVLLLAVAALTVYYFYPEPGLPPGQEIDRLVVLKSKRIMHAYSNGTIVRTYKISLGKNPLGHKQAEGDYRTPEGDYFINSRNDESGYHRNLGISYPNMTDRDKAMQTNTNPGGDIKIHGLRNGLGFIGKFQRWKDWTAGCIALTDAEVDELAERVRLGTPITILP